jgi:hypothetical protein
MNYHTDYFKPENHQLYPQLTLDYGEYARFIKMCEYLDHRLRGSWSYFVFCDTELSLSNVVLDNQIISIVSFYEIKIIEKFYYKIYFKYLEEKLNELTIAGYRRDIQTEQRFNNLPY